MVRVDGTVPNSFATQRGRVKRAWMLLRQPSFVWNSDGPAMGAGDSSPGPSSQRGLGISLGQPTFANPHPAGARAPEVLVVANAS